MSAILLGMLLPAFCCIALLAAQPDGARLLDNASKASKDGDYPAAIRGAEAAADAYRAAKDLAGEAKAHNTTGIAQTYAGSYNDAAATLRHAIEDARRANALEQVAESLMNLGNVLHYQAHYVAALQHYEESLKIAKELGPAAQRQRALLKLNIATLHQRLGNDEAALGMYLDTAADATTLRGHEQAQALVNLGVAYRRLGDPFKALEQYDRARALFSKHRHHDGELGALKNRGIVLALDLGELEQAARVFESAMKLARNAGARREAMQAQLYLAESLYRSGDYERAAQGFEVARCEAQDLKTSEEEWKAIYGLGRIALRRGDDAEAGRRFRAAVQVIESVRERIGQTSLKRDFFADKRDVYDALVLLMVRNADAAEAFSWLERGRGRTFQERVGSTTAILADVQRRIPAGGLLLDYWVSRRGSAVIWATRDASGLVPLGDLENPLPQQVTQASHVIVVPDGTLQSRPFETLRSNGRMLIEQASVSYLPTASVLLRAPPARTWKDYLPWSGGVAAFADPQYSAGQLGDTSQRLVHSAREAQQVTSALAGRHEFYIGAANQKSAFLRLSRPVLHLATHAVADARMPERSRILFSGAHEPGYLFLNDVYGLRLQNVELVTLSACDTGRGKNIAGEGAETFSRAFLAAGARSTITTLWRVDDAATAAFMADFYRRLGHGTSRAQALRETKLRFIRSGTAMADPQHWAAFILSGEPFEPLPQPPSWKTLAWLPLAFVPILLFRFVQTRPQRQSSTRARLAH